MLEQLKKTEAEVQVAEERHRESEVRRLDVENEIRTRA